VLGAVGACAASSTAAVAAALAAFLRADLDMPSVLAAAGSSEASSLGVPLASAASPS
jgi:hypothetical protein